MLGLFVDVPWAGWGGEWLESSQASSGMVVAYKQRGFTIKFSEPGFESVTGVQWGQLCGTANWPLATSETPRLKLRVAPTPILRLASQPRGRVPASAECWDMRRAEFVDKTGHAVEPMSRAELNRRSNPHRGAPVPTVSKSWLILGGDIDNWRRPDLDELGAALPADGDERKMLDWRITHGDLFVGPLGGLHGEHRCDHCNVLLFRDETRTKCCVGHRDSPQHGKEADWYGPFCSFPFIPQPDGEYRELWYGDDECSKHFLASTRMYNCAYAYSSLQAQAVKRKGKPVFQLRGTVYYRIAPAMQPPGQLRPSYSQLYVLDEEQGFDVRLRELLASKSSTGSDSLPTTGAREADSDNEEGGGGGGVGAARVSVRERRIRSVLPCVNSTMHANSLARLYKSAFESAPDAPIAKLKLHVDPSQIPTGGAAAGAHARQYNSPTADNVAIVLHVPSEDSHLDVVVHRRVEDSDNHLRRVSYSNGLFDALAFPIYFFKGTLTWHPYFKVPVRNAKRREISMMEFYASMLYVRHTAGEMPSPRSGVRRHADATKTRPNDNTWFFRGGRLFQQFVCSAAARYELKRMSILATPAMQKQIRAETYDQLKSALRDGEQPANIGQRVICPASVKGSRRAMYKLFLDCMAIVRKFGSPHLFITVTCNQGHRHVRASVLEGQSPDERSDIVNRFFAKQVDLLIEYVHAGKAFGELCAYCYVVEYQKRGNPHVHMVIRLKDGPLAAEGYDRYVSARLPPGPPQGNPAKGGACFRPGCCCREEHPPTQCGCDATTPAGCTCDSVLWHAVLKHMTHVCGYDSPCRDSSTGRCKYEYDRDRFTPTTLHAPNKRPEYRRVAPDAGGRFAHKMVRVAGSTKIKVKITDSHVVPYNPKLLLAPVGFEYGFSTRRLDAHEDRLIVSAIKGRHNEDDAWHSNVEISSNPTANIKYLYLYFCKGEDRLIVSVADDAEDEDDGAVNECKQHLNSQHYSPESSIWKLLGLKMNRQSHRCETLQLTYQGREYIRFDANASAQDVEASAEAQTGHNHTQAFFTLNADEARMFFRPEAGAPSSVKSVDIDGNPSSTCRPTHELTHRAYLGYLGPTASDLHPHAAELKYDELPYYYTYNVKAARWCRRSSPHKALDVVTRVAVIKPSAGDLFYMRLRLLYDCCKGCKSYEELRTVNSEVCDTFQEACIRDGLVADDAEWHTVMLEADQHIRPKGLRSLFVEILMNCEPQRPDELWEAFKDMMSADVAHENGRSGAPNDADRNAALLCIRDELQDFPGSKTLAECKLPEVDESVLPASYLSAEERAERLLFENRQHVLLTRYETKLAQINDGQHTTWERLKADIDEVNVELANRRSRSDAAPAAADVEMEHAGVGDHSEVDSASQSLPKARAHFIYARGGFGKTFLDELILDYVRGNEGYALAMASSGIASLLLEGARTVHSRLKVPIEITEGKVLSIRKHQSLADLIRKATLLLWDECTMLPKEVLELIDRSLRDLMDNDLPFGGKLFIFTGDWAQCLPVAKSRFATVTATHLQSDLWLHVCQHELTVNERVRQCQLRGNPERARTYAEWDDFLSQVGAGKVGSGVTSCDGTAHDAAKLFRLPEQIVFEGQTLADFIDFIYPDIASNYTDAEWLTQRAILAPKNEDVDAINAEVLPT